MTNHFFSDTAVLLGRSLRHITRSPDTIITTAIMPIAMLLLFVCAFGGAINSGSDSYVNYLLPGILLILIATGITYTAFRLFTDMQSGIFERFHGRRRRASSRRDVTSVLAAFRLHRRVRESQPCCLEVSRARPKSATTRARASAGVGERESPVVGSAWSRGSLR